MGADQNGTEDDLPDGNVALLMIISSRRRKGALLSVL
jgi:hypothetical protein